MAHPDIRPDLHALSYANGMPLLDEDTCRAFLTLQCPASFLLRLWQTIVEMLIASVRDYAVILEKDAWDLAFVGCMTSIRMVPNPCKTLEQCFAKIASCSSASLSFSLSAPALI